MIVVSMGASSERTVFVVQGRVTILQAAPLLAEVSRNLDEDGNGLSRAVDLDEVSRTLDEDGMRYDEYCRC